MPAISAKELTKTYTTTKRSPGAWGAVRSLFRPERVEVQAVKSIDLSIEQGEMVGFLGPNGAGKTTTLKMLSGILWPTSGEAVVLGHAPHKRNHDMLRRISLLMGNKMQLWWDLPAWDGFLVLKELYEVDDARFKSRTEALIEELDLQDKIHIQVRKLSLGERMKAEIVAALIHSPDVIFLDEPTIGLDVVSQKRIRDFLRRLHKQDGNTIVLTSHYMQDVQELCKRVIIIDHGSIVFDGQLDELVRRHGDTRRVRLTFADPIEPTFDLAKFGAIVESGAEEVVLEVARSEIAAVTATILSSVPVADLAIQDVDVEDVIRDLFTQGASDVSRETSGAG